MADENSQNFLALEKTSVRKDRLQTLANQKNNTLDQNNHHTLLSFPGLNNLDMIQEAN